MRLVIGIDAGKDQSGIVYFDADDALLVYTGVLPNDYIEHLLEDTDYSNTTNKPHLAMEWISNYGMAVGQTTFMTCYQVGRFSKCNKNLSVNLITRPEVKLALCNSMKAKDSNVRQQLIDMYGGREKAIGGKKCPTCKGKGWFGAGRPVCPDCGGTGWLYPPGPLKKVTSHAWAAIAVAVVFSIKAGYLNPLSVNPGGLDRSSQQSYHDCLAGTTTENPIHRDGAS